MNFLILVMTCRLFAFYLYNAQIMAMVAAMILRRNFKREDKLISGHQKSATYTAVRSRNI